jgi:hypothetical protein
MLALVAFMRGSTSNFPKVDTFEGFTERTNSAYFGLGGE